MINEFSKGGSESTSHENQTIFKIVDFNTLISKSDLHEINQELEEENVVIEPLHIGGLVGPIPVDIELVIYFVLFEVTIEVLALITFSSLKTIGKKVFDLKKKKDEITFGITCDDNRISLNYSIDVPDEVIISQITELLKLRKVRDLSDINPKG